jgi:radical SAM superfamily enzyme YgiQ (UPF0313 family)
VNVVLFNPRAQRSHRRLPLSLLSLARAIPDRHPWILVDGNVEPDAEARLRRLCAVGEVALLVSVMPGPQLRVATPLCRALVAANPRLRVVWGGYFPTVHAAVCVRDVGVSAVVGGQGEGAIAALLDAFDAGQSGVGLPGVTVSADGAVVVGPRLPAIRGDAHGPFPYARVDMDRYAAPTFLGKRTFNHHSSVGCPYFCNFCAVVNLFEGRWIPDTAESVVGAVRTLAREHRADAIEFHDNNFFAWERRCREVADGIADLSVAWWGEGRIDTMLGFSGATWEAMARSGLRMVFFGAESGDDAALDRMDKGGLRSADTRELNRLARRHGIAPEFSFVLGNADDPERDIAMSLALVRDLKADNPDCEIILYLYTPVPLPGQYDEARRRGFAFPDTLDGWLSPPWTSFDHRRDASTPWMRRATVSRIHDFETVLNARWPTQTDRNLTRPQRAILRALSHARWRWGVYRAPWELRALQRVFRYRRPEEMGF